MAKQEMRGPQLATAVKPSERRVRPADLVPAWGLAGWKKAVGNLQSALIFQC